MKLHEIAPHRLTHGDIAIIEDWLYQFNIKTGTYKIDPLSGAVAVRGNVCLDYCQLAQLPLQFEDVSGSFSCQWSDLTSLKGFPRWMAGSLRIRSSQIQSLHGIEKVIEHVGNTIELNSTTTHILGILLINVGHISIDDGGPIDTIMNRYKNTGDVISAQDELIDAGFKDQARL